MKPTANGHQYPRFSYPEKAHKNIWPLLSYSCMKCWPSKGLISSDMSISSSLSLVNLTVFLEFLMSSHKFYLYVDEGCEVHAYDPTVDLSNKKINFNFYKIGVSHINSKRDKKLSDLMKANGHNNKHITMIKMDIEGGELLGLDAWLEEGSLDNVHQIALEYHLYGGGLERARQFLSTVQNLNKHQFRTISWEANSCFQNTNQHIKRGDYFNLAEIVWVRISNSYNVSEACGY